MLYPTELRAQSVQMVSAVLIAILAEPASVADSGLRVNFGSVE